MYINYNLLSTACQDPPQVLNGIAISRPILSLVLSLTGGVDDDDDDELSGGRSLGVTSKASPYMVKYRKNENV